MLRGEKPERPSSDSVPRAEENGCKTCVPIIGAEHAPILLDLCPPHIALCVFVIQKASWPYTHFQLYQFTKEEILVCTPQFLGKCCSDMSAWKDKNHL